MTRFKFQTFAAPSINVFALSYPAGSVADVMGAWQTWMQDAPNELWTTLVVSAGNPPSCRISGSFVGTPAALNDLISKLRNSMRSVPRSVSSSQKAYLDAMHYFAGCSTKTTAQCHLAAPGGPGQLERESFYASSRIVEGPIANPQAISDLLRAYSGVDCLIDSLGGQVSTLAPSDTAFVHRNAIASCQIYKGCTAATKAAAVRDVGGIQQALAGIVGAGAYANYIDPNQTDWATATYGANLPQLQALSAQVDPDLWLQAERRREDVDRRLINNNLHARDVVENLGLEEPPERALVRFVVGRAVPIDDPVFAFRIGLPIAPAIAIDLEQIRMRHQRLEVLRREQRLDAVRARARHPHSVVHLVEQA